MTITIEISTAEKAFVELLSKVEAGEDVVFARGANLVARLTRVPSEGAASRAIDNIRALRSTLPKTTIDEIIAWKDEDRR